MPFTLNREMQGPADREWKFRVTRTRDGSVVEETFEQVLSRGVVVQIFRDVVGAVPAIGLERDDIDRHWNVLEPRLRAEIERELPADQ
jgi:adenosylmethionine-8-amino-7-oxononanoate aminotransferase